MRNNPQLVGEHDFSAFRSAGSSTRSPIRNILRADWKRERTVCSLRSRRAVLEKRCAAIVGTLVEVAGKINAEEYIREILESKDSEKAGPTAPAQGLFL